MSTFPLGPFTPYEGNPILRPRGTGWESGQVYNPAAIVRDDAVVLLYRAHADDIVSHVGLAVSEDGIDFEREPDPVLSPQEPYEVHGVEDPRVTAVDGTYYLTYTGWDGDRALLCLATSTDLHDWTRHGPLFPDVCTFAAHPGTPGPWSKAGGILPVQVDGRWLMYFGEGSIYHAWSDDLLHWKAADPTTPVLAPEPGTWSEYLVEVGPPPLLLDDGRILLVYNAATKSPTGVRYVCGQAVIDPADPGRVARKLPEPWLEPHTAEELSGLVGNVTFVEGLVRHRGRWLAYYGQSDSTLGVAVAPGGG